MPITTSFLLQSALFGFYSPILTTDYRDQPVGAEPQMEAVIPTF